MANYTEAPINAKAHTSPNGATHSTMTEPHYDNADAEDDESDVSMDSDSDDDENDPKIHVNTAQLIQSHGGIKSFRTQNVQQDDAGSSKQDLDKSHTGDQDIMDTSGMESYRRPRLVDGHQAFRKDDGHLLLDLSLLPAEIWHHIFTFTPPRTLGRLLQVNKVFNAYLDSSSLVPSPPATNLPISAAKILDPKTIWSVSRKLYRPGMPTPLTGMSELDMFRLACMNSCQFCGKVSASDTHGNDIWHSGPGQEGIHPIWPFSIRACGNCLQAKSIKEIDLLLSSSIPSPLMAALPFVFLTNELNVVSPTALESGAPPPFIQITKVFLKSHIDEIKREFFGVKSMGSGTAEEWLKGLEDRGREKKADAAKWEKWELSGGVARMKTTEPNERPIVRNISIVPQLPEKPNVQLRPLNIQTSLHNTSAHYTPAPTMNGHSYPPPFVYPAQTTYVSPRFDSPAQNGFGHPPPSMPQFRQPRTKEEAAEMKAARKAEIERRCMLLDPPLKANVLVHIPSFQAALQIIKPMDDNAWELLEPRLLAQRAEAEMRENDRIAQTRLVQEQFDERRYQDTQAKEAKEVVEKEWEHVQSPIRNRLGGFADEIIREGWTSGLKVTEDTSPKFAAEVLIYVRKRFYAEIEEDDTVDRAAGKDLKTDTFDGPFTRKLTLENMKWVFDNKVRPYTEQYRKEIFLCNGCDNSKFYGFEGVIQHYAAKHTSDLSLGSIVVHWRSEWPKHPPFQADPGSTKPEYHQEQPSGVPHAFNEVPYSNTRHGGYSDISAPQMVPPHVSQSYQHSPAPHYASPQNGEPFGGQYSQQFPQQPYTSAPGYQPVYADPHAGGYQQYPGGQHQGTPVQNLGHSPHNFEHPQTAQYHPSIPIAQGQGHGSFEPQGGSYPDQYGVQTGTTYPGFEPPLQSNVPLQGEAYQIQLEDVARSAKEAWSATAGIKDLPGSVRVATLLNNILKQSRAKYPTDPPLTMLIDGLSNHKEMRQVRNINNLSCKTCSNLLANGQPLPVNPKSTSGQEKRIFSFPQLLNHFQSLHIAITQGDGPADWTQDMVELPELDRIGRLVHINGMDDYKLSFIADAMPAAFPWPLPPVAQAKAHNATQMNRKGGDGGSAYKSHKNHNKSVGRDSAPYHGYDRREGSVSEASSYPRHGRSTSEFDEAHRPLEPREVDEYGREIIRAPRNSYSVSYDHGASLYGEKGELSLARQLELLEQKARSAGPPAGSQDTSPTGLVQPDPCYPSIPPRFDAIETGSEDGEVQSNNEPILRSANGRGPVRELSDLDRFHNDYVVGESSEDLVKKAEEEERKQEEALRASWAAERVETAKRMYQPSEDDKTMQEDTSPAPSSRYQPRYTPQQPSPVAPPPQVRPARIEPPVSHQPRMPVVNYAERYGPPAASAPHARERSPELVDHRYKLNTSVYRDERQVSRGAHRSTPSRYARYESIRQETERARSRSPIYVKVGAEPAHYRERSPATRPQPPQPLYRGRTPAAAQPEPAIHHLPPRQEYYTMYDEEPQPRARHPQVVEEPLYEYIQIADPNGDYIVRRAIRREAEPVYVQYPEDPYARQPVYESRRPVVYEERPSMYDERRPVYEERQPVYADDDRQPIYADDARQAVYAERQPIHERAAPPIPRNDPSYFEEYDPSQPALPPSAGARIPRYQ